MDRRTLVRACGLAALAGATGGCAADELLGIKETVRVAVTWSGDELAAFRRVLNRALSMPPAAGYDVQVVPYGDDIASALGSRGTPRPDVVMLPRPSQVEQFAIEGELAAIDEDLWERGSYSRGWRNLLHHNDKPFGLPFKAAHKSLIWYRKDLTLLGRDLQLEGWNHWMELVDELRRQGIPPLALGGADSWVLTDFFENVLLSLDSDTYDKLSTARLPHRWESASVQRALTILGELWRRSDLFPGGVGRALTLQFPDAVRDVFQYRRAAMVLTTDFAEPLLRRIHPGQRRRSELVGVVRFPAVPGGKLPLVAGGDVIVLPAPAAQDAKDLARRLAHTHTPLPWISTHGGFIAANNKTNRLLVANAVRDEPGLVRYSPELDDARQELQTEQFSFDLSDRIGPVGDRNGLGRALRDFLIDLDGIADSTSRTTVEAAIDKAARRAIDRLRSMEDKLLADGPDDGLED